MDAMWMILLFAILFPTDENNIAIQNDQQQKKREQNK